MWGRKGSELLSNLIGCDFYLLNYPVKVRCETLTRELPTTTTRLFLEFYVRNHRQALNEARPINKENKAFFLPSDPDWIAETEEENICGDENRGGGFYSWARYSYTLRENCLLFLPIRKQSTEGLKLWYLRHPDIHCHCGGMRNMTVISTFLHGTSEMNANATY